MRDNFAVFILTHGRADNVITLKSLKRAGYTGKWYLIVDNEDDQISLYEKKYGKNHVIVFDKQAAYDRADTMDNFNKHGVIIYARNECYRIAEELGLTYFLELDDDYTTFEYRYEDDGKLRHKDLKSFDRICEDMLDFLDVSGALTVAFAQGGDFIGGASGGNFRKGLMRKAMNSFFCRVDRPMEFLGTFNEDVTAYTTLGSRGNLLFSLTAVSLDQKQTQSNAGGMTDAYLDGGTYLKSFYSVISMPSAVTVSMMNSGHKRIHHHVKWNNAVPKILNEKWRKQ